VNAAKFDEKKIFVACGKSPFAEKIPSILAEAHQLLHGDQQKRLSQSE
jgi:hypothetical protein